MARPGFGGRSSKFLKQSEDAMRFIMTVFIGILFGFLLGISFPSLNPQFPTTSIEYIEEVESGFSTQASLDHASDVVEEGNKTNSSQDPLEIYVTKNPRGAEKLPPGIVVSESDLYMHRLWGDPSEDLPIKPKYLVTFTVGYKQKAIIDSAVKKFSNNFTIMLFHYDERTSEWDEFEWSKRAIHVSGSKQSKWWFAKRFLHPDIVASYDYIFVWDEDLGVEHFDPEEYIRLARKHGLEISQPGLESEKGYTWNMTHRRDGVEAHKETEEVPGRCTDPHLPPCAAFVEIMATVFSRDAWRCVWYMIQNDLVHGWGIDFALRKCVKPAHEKIGVIDAQWIDHLVVPSLGSQGDRSDGRPPWEGVRDRCVLEWEMFKNRIADAEKKYYEERGITPPDSTVS